MLTWIKKVYVYLFSAISLIIVIIGSVQLIDLALKAWVFTKADRYYSYPSAAKLVSETCKTGDTGCANIQEPSQEEVDKYEKDNLSSRRQQQASVAIAMILVGLPVFVYHWRIAKKFEN